MKIEIIISIEANAWFHPNKTDMMLDLTSSKKVVTPNFYILLNLVKEKVV